MEDVQKTYDFYMEKYNKQHAGIKKIQEMLNFMADDLKIQKPFPNIVDESQHSNGLKTPSRSICRKAGYKCRYRTLNNLWEAGWSKGVERDHFGIIRAHGIEGLP